MGRYIRTREGDDSQDIRALPKENLIIAHNMMFTWWFYLMYRLVHSVICPGAIEKVLVMTKKNMNLVYTYAKLMLNNTPGIINKLTHVFPLISWTPSRLAWFPAFQGRYQSLQFPHPLHSVCRDVQPGGSNQFWHIYVVHNLGLRVHSFHWYLLWSLHMV